jgi:hypothetical protein
VVHAIRGRFFLLIDGEEGWCLRQGCTSFLLAQDHNSSLNPEQVGAFAFPTCGRILYRFWRKKLQNTYETQQNQSG